MSREDKMYFLTVVAFVGFQFNMSTIQQTHLASKSVNFLKSLLAHVSGTLLLPSPPFKIFLPVSRVIDNVAGNKKPSVTCEEVAPGSRGWVHAGQGPQVRAPTPWNTETQPEEGLTEKQHVHL